MPLTVRSAAPADEPGIVELWRVCDLVASYNDPTTDFRFAKAGACSDVLIGEDEMGHIIGSVMVGHDGHQGWLYYVATSPTREATASGGRWSRPASTGCASGEW